MKRRTEQSRLQQLQANVIYLFAFSYLANVLVLAFFGANAGDGECTDAGVIRFLCDDWMRSAVVVLLQSAQFFVLEVDWDIVRTVSPQPWILVFLLSPVVTALTIAELFSVSVRILLPRLKMRYWGGHIVIVGDSEFSRQLAVQLNRATRTDGSKTKKRPIAIVDREFSDESRRAWQRLNAKIIVGDAEDAFILHDRAYFDHCDRLFALTGDVPTDLDILREWYGLNPNQDPPEICITRRISLWIKRTWYRVRKFKTDKAVGISLVPSATIQSIDPLLGLKDGNGKKDRRIEVLSADDVNFRFFFDNFEETSLSQRLIFVGFNATSWSFLKTWVQLTVLESAFETKPSVWIYTMNPDGAKQYLDTYSFQIRTQVAIHIHDISKLASGKQENNGVKTVSGLKDFIAGKPVEPQRMEKGAGKSDVYFCAGDTYEESLMYASVVDKAYNDAKDKSPWIAIPVWEADKIIYDHDRIVSVGGYEQVIHEIQRVCDVDEVERQAHGINCYWKLEYGDIEKPAGDINWERVSDWAEMALDAWSMTPIWERESTRMSRFFFEQRKDENGDIPAMLEYLRWRRQKAMQNSLDQSAPDNLLAYEADGGSNPDGDRMPSEKEKNELYLNLVKRIFSAN